MNSEAFRPPSLDELRAMFRPLRDRSQVGRTLLDLIASEPDAGRVIVAVDMLGGALADAVDAPVEEAVERLTSFLRRRDGYGLRASLRALGKIGAEAFDALPVMLRYRAHPNPHAREHARTALERITKIALRSDNRERHLAAIYYRLRNHPPMYSFALRHYSALCRQCRLEGAARAAIEMALAMAREIAAADESDMAAEDDADELSWWDMKVARERVQHRLWSQWIHRVEAMLPTQMRPIRRTRSS